MSLKAHLAVQRDPFSHATKYAKVCDGLVSSSCSIHQKDSFPLTCSGNSQFVFSPSFSAPLLVLRPTGSVNRGCCIRPNPKELLLNVTNEKLIDSKGSTYKRDGAGVQLFNIASVPAGESRNSISVAMTDTEKDYAITGFKNSVFSPSKFRIVSAGLRISLVNDHNTNEGWFEAIRIPNSDYRLNESMLVTTTGDKGDTLFGVCPHINDFSEKLLRTEKNWPNAGTMYQHGRLCDLKDFRFDLHLNGGKRDFKNVPVDTQLKVMLEGQGPTSGAYAISGSQGPGDFFDNSFDTIAVNVYGNDSCNFSLKVETCVNYEVIYESDNPLSHTMTKGITSPNSVNFTDGHIKRHVSPGVYYPIRHKTY